MLRGHGLLEHQAIRSPTFRYAPLSSGLGIVRKVLGQHEIATVQATANDKEAGLIRLTTTLANSSGEWISSDWPACPITQTATPHRMGAALTYARRYALFTLVGIAGQDDLDALDLLTNQTSGPEKPKGDRNRRLNGGHENPAQRSTLRHDVGSNSNKPILEPEGSAKLRDRLIAELNDLGSGDDAAIWAHRCLGEKNKLSAADAQHLEEAFQTILATLAADEADQPKTPAQPLKSQRQNARKSKNRPRSKGIDKGVLTFPEPRRIRDRNHVKSVAQQPCLICGRQPADSHHLRFAAKPGTRAQGQR